MRPVAMVRRVCNGGTGLDWATCSADYEYYDIVTERRGAPVMVVDATRNVIWSGKYSPYGLLYDKQGSLEFNLRLPGQYQDRETGWHYNGQRYYIPQMMRYNRPEPIGQAGSLDLYMYAGGDPVNRIDPTGLDDEPDDAVDSGPSVWGFLKYLFSDYDPVEEAQASIQQDIAHEKNLQGDMSSGLEGQVYADQVHTVGRQAAETSGELMKNVAGGTVTDTIDAIEILDDQGLTPQSAMAAGMVFLGGIKVVKHVPGSAIPDSLDWDAVVPKRGKLLIVSETWTRR